MYEFADKVTRAILKNNSILCCGLDPDIRKLPKELLLEAGGDNQRAVVEFLFKVIDITIPYVCAYKIQKAFFDVHPLGHSMLERVVTRIRQLDESVPIILDCKVGDISNTMEAYLHMAFECMCVDAIVLNPYMGREVIESIQPFQGRGAVILVRTSNPGSASIQELIMYDGRPLWRSVLDIVMQVWNAGTCVIPVLSANSSRNMTGIRDLLPTEMPILVSGFGSQGATPEDVRCFLGLEGLGAIVNSSRAILYPFENEDQQWSSKIHQAVLTSKHLLNSIRK